MLCVFVFYVCLFSFRLIVLLLVLVSLSTCVIGVGGRRPHTGWEFPAWRRGRLEDGVSLFGTRGHGIPVLLKGDANSNLALGFAKSWSKTGFHLDRDFAGSDELEMVHFPLFGDFFHETLPFCFKRMNNFYFLRQVRKVTKFWCANVVHVWKSCIVFIFNFFTNY